MHVVDANLHFQGYNGSQSQDRSTKMNGIDYSFGVRRVILVRVIRPRHIYLDSASFFNYLLLVNFVATVRHGPHVARRRQTDDQRSQTFREKAAQTKLKLKPSEPVGSKANETQNVGSSESFSSYTTVNTTNEKKSEPLRMNREN